MEKEDKSKIFKKPAKIDSSQLTTSQYLMAIYDKLNLEEEKKALRKKLLNEK